MITPEETTTAATGAATQTETTGALPPAGESNQGNTVRASWCFSLDSIRTNIAHCAPIAKDLLVWCFLWCIDDKHPIRLEEFCERVGYAPNTIYKIFRGKYLHPESGARLDVPEKLVKAMRDFKRNEQARAKLGRKKFGKTPTALRCFLACDLARESQTPVFVEGASHIGKTEAWRQYAIENNHGKTKLVEAKVVGFQEFVRIVAEAVGISPNGNVPDLIRRMEKAITSDMVLIIDEVHVLQNTRNLADFRRCMEFLRRLYDATQCGLVLSFTNLGYRKAESDRKKELEQIFRRGVHRVNLGDKPQVGDVKVILEMWGLSFPARNEVIEVKIGRDTFSESPFKMLEELAREQGLKAITERLRYGMKFAADAATGEAALEWEHVVQAHVTIAKNGAAPVHGWDN
jgi:DNA transposition AAA+ family ATPase